MKMVTSKPLSLLLLTVFINFFHPTLQKHKLSLSFPLHFADLSKASDHHNGDVAPSPSLSYRSLSTYSMALIASIPIGSPLQSLPMVLDTASELSWIHCATTKGQSISTTGPFETSLSFSFSSIPCKDVVCTSPHDNIGMMCGDKQQCHYSFVYTDQTPAEGRLVRETLFNFSDSKSTPVPLILGCADVNDRSTGAEGILGMNQGNLSFVSQANVTIFSYCVPRLNSSSNSNNSNGAFVLGPNNDVKFQYTSLVKYNQIGPNFDRSAYNVGLANISIGGKMLNIPKRTFRTQSNGASATILDSATQYTSLINDIYVKVKDRVLELAGSRLIPGYANGTLEMCFNGTSTDIGRMIHEMMFVFGGGSTSIVIDGEKTLADVATGVSCFAVGNVPYAPDNIIGNFHQQNYWVEYDLTEGRIGFGKTDNCSKFV